MEYNNKGNPGEVHTNNPLKIKEIYNTYLEDSTKTGKLDMDLTKYSYAKPHDNFVKNFKNRYNIEKSVISLLPTRKIPECWEEIESLILKRIGEYPEIEVGGLILTNGMEFEELSYRTGDENSIGPENVKYRFEVDSEEFKEIFYRLNDNFLMRKFDGYIDRFLSGVKENIENSDSDSEVLDKLGKIEVEKPKEFNPYEYLVYINYHSHPNGYLKPSRADIRSAQNNDGSSEVLYVIAGKGRCEWYRLRFF